MKNRRVSLQQRLSEVREWVGRVRVFDVAVTTAWRMLHVDCAGVHARLVPQLEAICDEICVFVAALARGRSQTLVDELNYVGDVSLLCFFFFLKKEKKRIIK